MKTYEIKKIRASLVADICEFVENHIEYLKELNLETLERLRDADERIDCILFNEASVKIDLLSKIEITVDGIEL